jgi:UDP:flavonoid glycosyltransferase YjiC (YdhE family)
MINVNKRKPLLLIFPFNVLAHYLRCLKLAQYLNSYFEIQFLFSERYISFIEGEGYSTFNCASFNADKVQEGVRKFDFSWLNEQDIEKVYLDQVRIINELKPAVVLADTVPTLRMAAEKTGTTYLTLTNGYMTSYYANVRKMPGSHPLYKYIKVLPGPLAKQLIKKGEALAFEKIHQPFRKVRERYGLAFKQSYQQETEGDVNLICDLPELYPQKNLPPNYHFIPALFYEAKIDSVEIINKLDKNKKTLFVSMGSTGEWNNVSFLNDLFFTRYNIITAGDLLKVVKTTNVVAASFVNIRHVFPFVDLVLCHGGNGTIYQALSYGLPILCKTSHFEQEWNVEAIEQLKLGKGLDGVKSIQQYKTIFNEWMQKKNSDELCFIKNLLKASGDNFDRVINEIWEEIFLPVHARGSVFSIPKRATSIHDV